MTFPTLQTLEQRNLAQIKAQFPNLEPEGQGILEVMARMHASAMHLAYGMIDYHTQQLFPQTATGQFLDNLLAWRPLPRLSAKKAKGTVTAAGKVGSVIAKDTVIAADNGQRYLTLKETTLSAPNQIIKVQAVKPGAAGNATNQKGQWESSINGMSASVLVNATGGTDSESDEEYRLRALETIQQRGSLYGKKGDYALWAIDSDSEIIQAWEVPNFESTEALGVVVAGNSLARVSDGALKNATTAIEQNRLAGVETSVVRASAKILDFQLAIVPNTADMRVAVENSLQTYIREGQKPAAEIILKKLDKYLEENVSGLNSVAIQAPTVDITSTQREILTLGTVTWA